MRTHSILIALVIVLSSCSGGKTNFRISCDITSANDQTLYLSKLTLTGRVEVDSALPDRSGRYVLEGYTEIPDFFIVYFDENQYINLILRPGDDVQVQADAITLDSQYFVEGSMDSRLVQKLISRQVLTLRQITEISTEYENSRGSANFGQVQARIDSTYDRLVAEHRMFSLDLIRENPGSLATLMTLYQQLGRNIAVFDEQKDYAVYQMVDSSLSALYPTSEAVKDLDRKVIEIRESMAVAVGSTAPDIAMADSTGSTVTLSSLRGKFVLLYFWASWSPESIEQNKVLASLYERYSLQELEYYQVSLDRTRESWINGLQEQHSPGIQVSDLGYWDSPVVETYRISEIPQTYLLDKEGKIIDKGFEASEFAGIFSDFLENGSPASANSGP